MNKEILKLAVPNIISNISVPLLSTVDTALMGHLSAAHLGAVGVGSMIFNFIYWNFGFLRMGSTGMTAQAYGAGDEQEITDLLGRILLCAMVIASVILLLQYPLDRAGIYLMNVDSQTGKLVSEYFLIRILAAPATFALYGILGWLFGMQNAIYPLILTVFINVVNIVFSAHLVLNLGWDVAGVAWGTVIAQYAGLGLALVLLIYKYKKYIIGLAWKSVSDLHKFQHFFRVNSDIFVRTVFLTFVFGFFYSQSAKLGTLVLAGNVILLQLVNWMSYGIDGFAYAAESVVGKYKGAEDDAKLNTSIKLSFIWGGVLSLLYSIGFYIGEEQILNLFTSDNEVKIFTRDAMIWIVILPIFSFASYIWDGVYVGLTAVKAMRNSMIVSFALYMVVYYALEYMEIENSLWIAMIIFLAARGLAQTVLYWQQGNNLK